MSILKSHDIALEIGVCLSFHVNCNDDFSPSCLNFFWARIFLPRFWRTFMIQVLVKLHKIGTLLSFVTVILFRFFFKCFHRGFSRFALSLLSRLIRFILLWVRTSYIFIMIVVLNILNKLKQMWCTLLFSKREDFVGLNLNQPYWINVLSNENIKNYLLNQKKKIGSLRWFMFPIFYCLAVQLKKPS